MVVTQNRIRTEIFWAFASKGAALVGTYGLLLLLVQQLSLEEFGRWAFFSSILLILAQVSELGLNTAAKRWFAEHRDTPHLDGWIRSAFRLRLWASAAAGMIVALCAIPMGKWFAKPWLSGLLLAGTLWVALYGLVEFYKSLFEGVHRLRLTFLVNLTDHSIRILLCAIAWWATRELSALVLAYSLAACIACWMGARLRGLYLPRSNDPPVIDSTPLIRYSVPVFFMSAAAYVSTEIDILMIGTLLDDRATAIFALPKQLVAQLPHISVAFTMGSIPELARMNASGNANVHRQFRYILGRLALLYGVLLVIGGVVAVSLPREFIPKDYRDSVAPFVAMLPYVFFVALSNFTGAFLSYRGRAASRLHFLILVILINVFLNLLWIPRYGVVGAAWASSIAMIPYFLLNWALCEKMLSRIQQRP